mmetsp:Transcript_65919/g.158985  ORF Transcript_65919/g.158985 Transcript_65919/m.158985 type:complete len:231 (-) Transcript_65919:500-1192(-)
MRHPLHHRALHQALRPAGQEVAQLLLEPDELGRYRRHPPLLPHPRHRHRATDRVCDRLPNGLPGPEPQHHGRRRDGAVRQRLEHLLLRLPARHPAGARHARAQAGQLLGGGQGLHRRHHEVHAAARGHLLLHDDRDDRLQQHDVLRRVRLHRGRQQPGRRVLYAEAEVLLHPRDHVVVHRDDDHRRLRRLHPLESARQGVRRRRDAQRRAHPRAAHHRHRLQLCKDGRDV